MAFNFLVKFWRPLEENGSMTLTISEDLISILYYFNDENIDLEDFFELLNSLTITCSLLQFGWKLLFRMRVSTFETWNHDYFKRIEFSVNKLVFISNKFK